MDLVTLYFTQNQRIKIGEGPRDWRTVHQNTRKVMLRLGAEENQTVGIWSTDLTLNQIGLLKRNIKQIAEMSLANKLQWFQQYMPDIRIIRIRSSQIDDLLQVDGNDKLISKPIHLESRGPNLRTAWG